MQEVINGVAIEVVKGDIASQTDIAAVVNAANAELRMGGGVAGAIHMAAGPGLEEECRPQAPIRPGEAVITGGHNLPNDHVIHCLGPIYGRDKPEDRLLADCYRNALNLAEKYQLPSIAFPAISTGAFGYPTKNAAKITVQTIREQIPQLVHVRKIRFVLYSQGDYEVFEQLLA